MIRTMRRIGGLMALTAALAVGVGVYAAAGRNLVSAVAVTSSLTTSGDVATVKFTIEVSNQGEDAATGVSVVFSETYAVAVGDVAAGAKVASAAQQATFDLSGVPTHTVAVPVTVKYTAGGVAVEQATVLNFGRKQ